MGPKSEITPKSSQNQQLELKKRIGIKSCSTTCVDPKTVSKPYPDPKNSSLGPQKVKNKVRIKSQIE